MVRQIPVLDEEEEGLVDPEHEVAADEGAEQGGEEDGPDVAEEDEGVALDDGGHQLDGDADGEVDGGVARHSE